MRANKIRIDRIRGKKINKYWRYIPNSTDKYYFKGILPLIQPKKAKLPNDYLNFSITDLITLFPTK